jgi:hypothetical protein
MNEQPATRENHLFLWSLLAVATAIGLFGRLSGLGFSPLAVDEYLLAQSVENIIRNGLPVFDCGGYYTRGLLHQYLAAGLQLTGMTPEVALRSVSLVANLLTVPALFMIGSRIGGRSLALIASVIFMLSIWEIEYSRFGRMYALFQLAFAWHLWFLLKARDGDTRAYAACVAISVISLAAYEGAALLLVLNFLPLLERHVAGLKSWAGAMVALLGGIAFLSIDFRTVGADNAIPADYAGPLPGEGSWSLPIDQPQLLLAAMPAAAIAVALLAAVAMFFLAARSLAAEGKVGSKADIRTWIWLGLAAVAPVLNLFALAILVTLIFWVWEWPPFDRRWSRLMFIGGSWLALWLVIWTLAYWAAPDTIFEDRSVRDFVRTLFFYPDIYSEILYRWVRSMPFATILLFGSIAVGVGLRKIGRWRSHSARGFSYLTGMVLLLGLLVAILPQPYATIRYTFFLYPAIILAAACVWSAVIPALPGLLGRHAGAGLAVITVIFLTLSEDADPLYAWNIKTPEITYRMNMSKWRTDVVYRRWDYRSPAEFVNQQAANDDVLVTTMQSVPFYLDRLEYFYRSDTSGEFLAIAACGATRELWSNAGLVYKEQALEELVDSRTTGMWLIFRAPDRDEAWPIEATLGRKNKAFERYVSADDRIAVFYLPAPQQQ